MKRVTKITIVLAVLFLILGIALIGIGIANNGDVRRVLKDHDYSLLHSTFDMDFDKYSDNEDFTEVFQCSTDELQRLDIHMSTGNLVIKPSSDDTCKVVTLKPSRIQCSLEDKTLDFKNTSGTKRRYTFFYMSWLGDGDHNKSILYLPEKLYESTAIYIEAGSVKLYGHETNDFKLDVDAGTFFEEEVLRCETFESTVDVGSIEIEELYASKGTVKCKAGQFKMLGGLIQKADLDCQLGDIQLTLFEKEKNYSLDIDSGLGNVEVGSHGLSGIGETYIENGSNELKIRCNLGNVHVGFDEDNL